MSRRFTAANPDLMTYALPASGAGPVNFAFGTVLVIVRFVTAPTWASLIEIEDAAGTLKAGLSRDNLGNLGWSDSVTFRRSSDAGTGSAAFTVGTGDGWCLCAMTKPTGTVGVTLHKVPLATGVRESRTITATSVNASGLASGRIKIGGDDDPADVEYVLASVLPGVVLSGAQIDSIVAALTTASLVSLAPADGWVVDDSNAFATNLVANNTNRSAIAGTTDDVDDPAGWVYGLGGGTPGGAASSTAGAASTATGRRKALRAAVTTAGGTSTATGRRRAQRAAVSTAGASSTATGIKPGVETHAGAATTTAGAASAASGRRRALSHHDEVSAVPPFTIAVAGVLTTAGAASASTGTVGGVETHAGAATSTAGASSSASGRRKALRAAVTTCGTASLVTGRRVSRGNPVSTGGASSAATARRISRGACNTTAGAASTAAGSNGSVPIRSGSAASTAGALSIAAGRRLSRGACMTTAGSSSTASGTRPGAVTFAARPAGTYRPARIGHHVKPRTGRASTNGVVP